MTPLDPRFDDNAIQALIDPHVPPSDPLLKLVHLAMSGFGYNFYDARNVARSNDQIVRERAGLVLGETARALAAFERRYRSRFIPPASREAPNAPADALERLRAIDAARKHCEALVGAFASAETPATDAIWFRVREEGATLRALIAFDVELATGVDRARATLDALDLTTFDDDALGALESQLDAVDRAFAARRRLLIGA